MIVASPTATPPPTDDLGPQPCFALDQHVLEHPASRSEGALVVRDTQYGARYFLGPDSVTVSRDDPAPRSRAAVMRVVRELATARALADGSRLQLHAAALEHEGKLIVLAGPKRSGKTTLALRLAACGRLAIVGNDRLLLTPSPAHPGAWAVRGIPTVVSVRPGTRAQLGMFDDIPAAPSPAHLTVAELDAQARQHAPYEPGARVKVSLAQFARAAGVPLAGDGTLSHVLILAVDHDLDGFGIEPCRGVVARASLETVRYGSRPDGTPRTVFEEWLGVTRPSHSDRLRLDDLVGSVPVSTLTVGPAVLRDDRLVGELLARVVDHG